MTIDQVKQRFEIVGNNTNLLRAINIVLQVASTDLSVLITGENGTGKEMFPRIIHSNSRRKHEGYISINCGAIPEGTIDSELFGHEKGAFTGAVDKRKGYFEVADKGTIFLDEIGDLPMSTQAKFLRVLESGEYIKVGSSKVHKTDVRIITATNVDLINAIKQNKFREDLYFRLNTVPIQIPALRNRKEDIHLLFKKFARDFSEKYRMPKIKLTDNAANLLENYRWQGNVRQLKNVTEQISIIEKNREVSIEVLQKYLPNYDLERLPTIYKNEQANSSEREILYKILFDMKKDVDDLKRILANITKNKDTNFKIEEQEHFLKKTSDKTTLLPITKQEDNYQNIEIQETKEIVNESLSLIDKEKEMIKKALEKHEGKRKLAAKELGISERTLYRKISK